MNKKVRYKRTWLVPGHWYQESYIITSLFTNDYDGGIKGIECSIKIADCERTVRLECSSYSKKEALAKIKKLKRLRDEIDNTIADYTLAMEEMYDNPDT